MVVSRQAGVRLAGGLFSALRYLAKCNEVSMFAGMAVSGDRDPAKFKGMYERHL